MALFSNMIVHQGFDPDFDFELEGSVAYADAMPVAADDVADFDRADKVHFLNGNGNDASLCDFCRQYAAAQIHLRHNPAAENVLVGIGVARHGNGTQE